VVKVGEKLGVAVNVGAESELLKWTCVKMESGGQGG
jgi:hypothetical protein